MSGSARTIHDADWLLRHVGDVTDRFEAPRDAPWAVTDAPDAFTRTMVRGIVGIEIEVTDVEAQIKASQNRPQTDRQGVIEGLGGEDTRHACEMAGLVSRFAE